MKTTKVKVLKPQTIELPTEEQQQAKRLNSLQARRTLSTLLPDKLANSTFWVRNQMVPHAQKLFPLEWRMQYAELFYPHAEGGPLYIDMPKTEWDLELCKRKYQTLRDSGVRYVYLYQQVDENEARQLLEGA